MNPKPDATPDDTVARNFDEKSVKNSSKILENSEKNSKVSERSVDDFKRMILTRKGVYRVLESRISA